MTALLALLLAPPAWVIDYRTAYEDRILPEFIEFLRIPNVEAEGKARNAEYLLSAFRKRGLDAQLLTVPGAAPAVYAEWKAPGARQTVLFYAHYDGQPADARQWDGHGPFEPVLKSQGRRILNPAPGAPIDPEWRLHARGASDDKGAIQAMLSALEALRIEKQPPSVNLKFLFEGEEEAGSQNLGRILAAHRDKVAADYWLICDGPVHQTRRQQLYFGARGVTEMEITVYGPRRELHSGHYGNWAPNPALRLAQLLASMKDDRGRVTIRGFYDGIVPLTESEKRALAAEPAIEAELQRELLLGSTDNLGRRLNEVINEPSLNIRGLLSGSVGSESRNVVPSRAVASLDIRLVKGIDWRAAQERVVAHVRAQGYFVTEGEPTPEQLLAHPRVARIRRGTGYNAVRTSMDLPASRQVIRAAERVFGPVITMPTLGGSVPLSIIQEVINVPLIGVPIANHDNSQHAANENLRLKNLWDGIHLFAALFTME